MKNVSLATAWLSLLIGWPAMAADEPKFTVVEQRDGYELRQYEPYLVAQTKVNGSPRGSGSEAFRVLAGYIFGNNQQEQKMAMTIPVTSQLDHSASTDGATVYQWQFVMEPQYSAEALPTPLDSRVILRQIPARLMAARRYSGNTSQRNFLQQLAGLEEALLRDGLQPRGEPISAVYNGPFTPGFARRNEVLIELESAAAQQPSPTTPGE